MKHFCQNGTPKTQVYDNFAHPVIPISNWSSFELERGFSQDYILPVIETFKKTYRTTQLNMSVALVRFSRNNRVHELGKWQRGPGAVFQFDGGVGSGISGVQSEKNGIFQTAPNCMKIPRVKKQRNFSPTFLLA